MPEQGEIKELLVATYLEWADSLVESGNYYAAIDVLKLGFDDTADIRIKSCLEDLTTTAETMMELEENRSILFSMAKK